MFEDCAAIFAGYGAVDNIVKKCEKIAASLRAEIARWTDNGDPKGKSREGSEPRGSPVVSEADGALSLRSQALLTSNKPDYYISGQPNALSSDIQLKDYQMIGINWLNLLYTRKLSCILADEMGMLRIHVVGELSSLLHRPWQNRPGDQLLRPPEGYWL